MKRLLLLICLLLPVISNAQERRNLADISVNEFTSDTQVQAEGVGDRHLALFWWVPQEYWASVFSRDPSIPDNAREEMMNVLKQYSVIAVVQADVSSFGGFNFYSKDEVVKTLNVSFQNSDGKAMTLMPAENVSSDMTLLMGQIAPVLQAAMGNLGANFHFFIYDDFTGQGKRILDPYKTGELNVTVKNRSGDNVDVAIKTPLNSLFVPRICPNGEKAHVSWSYCPWSGKKL